MSGASPRWALSSSGTGVLHRIDSHDGVPCTNEDGLWRALCLASTEPESADAVKGTALVCSVCADTDHAVA
jgi:hypothetical protein